MKKIISLLSFFIMTISITAAPTDTITRSLEDFHALVVFGNIKVEMRKAETNSLTMYSHYYDIAKVTTMVVKGILQLKSNAIGDEKEVIVKLFYKNIDDLKVDAGANIVKTDSIIVEDLHIKVTKGSLCRMLIRAQKLDVEINQGSEFRAYGSAKNISVVSNSGALFDCYSLITNNAEIRANTGGKINIFVKDKITAFSQTGSIINYKGKPKIESVDPSMGGTINKL